LLRCVSTVRTDTTIRLAISTLDSPAVARRAISRGSSGSYMLLTNVVSNLGSAPPGAFTVGFYLSADPDITTTDTRIGTRSVATLLPGTNSTSVVTVTLSTTLPKGTFYLGAIADYLNQVQEITETNNTIVMAVSPIEILNARAK